MRSIDRGKKHEVAETRSVWAVRSGWQEIRRRKSEGGVDVDGAPRLWPLPCPWNQVGQGSKLSAINGAISLWGQSVALLKLCRVSGYRFRTTSSVFHGF